jgi:hypothetical protein
MFSTRNAHAYNNYKLYQPELVQHILGLRCPERFSGARMVGGIRVNVPAGEYCSICIFNHKIVCVSGGPYSKGSVES